MAEAGDNEDPDKKIRYEKKILHTYNIAGKQIKDWMELTINDSVTKKTWYKKFTQDDFQTAIKEVYGTIKSANAEDKISFTYPDDDPDNGQLAMDVNGEFTINLPPKQI